MKLKDCHNISDLRKAAEKRLPAAMFHYIDGAAGDEWTIKHNTNSFEQYEVIPNYLVDVDKITAEKVKEATLHLKQNKSDPLYDFNSDCLTNAS